MTWTTISADVEHCVSRESHTVSIENAFTSRAVHNAVYCCGYHPRGACFKESVLAVSS